MPCSADDTGAAPEQHGPCAQGLRADQDVLRKITLIIAPTRSNNANILGIVNLRLSHFCSRIQADSLGVWREPMTKPTLKIPIILLLHT